MKRLIFILVIVGLFSCSGYAQEKKWTLSECIDYAVTHNIEVGLPMAVQKIQYQRR